MDKFEKKHHYNNLFFINLMNQQNIKHLNNLK